jgi:hypothetical protein
MTVPAVHNAQQAARLTAQRPQGRADCDLRRSFSAGFSRVRLSFLSGTEKSAPLEARGSVFERGLPGVNYFFRQGAAGAPLVSSKSAKDCISLLIVNGRAEATFPNGMRLNPSAGMGLLLKAGEGCQLASATGAVLLTIKVDQLQ